MLFLYRSRAMACLAIPHDCFLFTEAENPGEVVSHETHPPAK